MKIKLTSIMVEDQDRALAFYTQVLGFKKKREFPAALTGGSPSCRPRARTTSSCHSSRTPTRPARRSSGDVHQGIPVAAFEVADIAAEFARLKAAGVAFTSEPARMAGHHRIFTCGNLMLYQPG